MTDAFLSLSKISKRFGSSVALRDVSFDVHPGEVHALLGENGAGKSTLMRVAYGLTSPDSGEISVQLETGGTQSRRIASPREARALGIGMVHQHFTSIPALTVADNLALVAGWRGGGHAARATALIDRLHLPLDATARVRDLTVQLRQRLEIVQALATDASILLLDEPTAVLAPREVGELLELVRRFRDQGGAVVLITHKLAEVTAVADRITVLRRGEVTLSGFAREFDHSALSRAMIGNDSIPDLALERRGSPGTAHPDAPRAVRLELRGLASSEALPLHGGEIIGIAAIEGNGQRELMRAIGGMQPDASLASAHGIVAFVPEDRTSEALIGDFSLTANLLLGNLDRAPRWLDWQHLDQVTENLLARHDVRAAGVSSPAASLSGGNQQKFILGRALDRRPDILVAENPTRGLDLLASASVHHALRQAAQQGSCVVLHSTDLDEVLALADRLLVVANGVVRELPIDTPRDAVGDAMLGLA